MKKPFVFLDIDGTILDPRYEFNVANPASTFTTLVNDGWEFAFNSNRALEDMLPLYEKLRLNGAIVAENAAYIYFPQQQTFEYLANESDRNSLLEIKRELPELLKKIVGEFLGSVPEWIETDTVNVLQTKKLQLESGKQTQTFILSNAFRKYSASLHIRILTSQGQSLPTEAQLSQIVAALKAALGEKEALVSISYSKVFANILLNLRSLTKRDGVEALATKFKETHDFYFIGDELGDAKMASGIGTLLTVDNAVQEVKERAQYVSKHQYLQGTIECLNWIKDQVEGTHEN